MTSHLTDSQLNEILDNRADTSSIRHTENCTNCRARLNELRTVFNLLDSLPEAKNPHDLTASILANLPQRRAFSAWKWLFAAQAIGALAIVASMASNISLPSEVMEYQPPTFDSLIASALTFPASISFEFPALNVKISSIDLQSSTILLFVISAAALWLVGNGLLLRLSARSSRE